MSPRDRRQPPPRPPDGDPEPAPAAEPRRNPFGPVRAIALGGAVLVVVVVAIALATGTADDLPWGAVIGVVIILGAMVVTARRREQRMREAFPDDEE